MQVKEAPVNRRDAKDAEISNRFSASFAPLRFFRLWVLLAAPPRCVSAVPVRVPRLNGHG